MVTTGNEFKNVVEKIKDNIQKVIVGKSESIDLILISLLCKGHVLIEDVPGSGKTTLARAVSDSLDCTFGRIQFTPDLMPSDVLGVNWFNQKSRASSKISNFFVLSNIFFAPKSPLMDIMLAFINFGKSFGEKRQLMNMKRHYKVMHLYIKSL